MTYHYYGARPAVGYDAAVVAVPPSDAAFSVSDLAGTFVKDAGKIRLLRSTSDGQGFEHCAPGARVRFTVLLQDAGKVEVDIAWTGLVTRTDTYNALGEILVNGKSWGAFSGPAKAPADPHPVGSSTISLPLTAGLKLIEVIFPYCASMDFEGVRVPASATMQPATPRPTKRGVFFGDSITHGFNVTKSGQSWAFLTAAAKSAQILNHGYGGRQLVSADGTTCGAYGCDFGFYLIGFNDFYPNGGSLAAFKNSHKALQGNWRAASTGAGKPAAPLYCLTPTWSSSDTGFGGPYVGNNPTLEQYRQAVRDAIAEQADPYVILVEGRAPGMPSGAGKFPDGIHPNNVASAEIRDFLAGAIA